MNKLVANPLLLSNMSLEPASKVTAAIYIEEEDELHPPAVFRQSYRELPPYQNTAFG
jgi:hypothetical protein